MNKQKSLYYPLQSYFRTKRLSLLYRTFQITASTRVLDLGGNLFFWEIARKRNFDMPQITVINLFPPPYKIYDNMKWTIGNGKQLPFKDSSFDLVFCNSVIEHLGDWESQMRFAAEIRRVAPRYFVQTPAREFPIETHMFAPFIHWFPKSMQAMLAKNATLWGWITRPSPDKVHALLNELRLLNRKEMVTLFPESTLITERLLFFPKSLIAVR